MIEPWTIPLVIVFVSVFIIILLICWVGDLLGRKIDEKWEEYDLKKKEKMEREKRGEVIEEPKEKIGIIFSNLEGILTEEDSFWKDLNLEMGMSEEEDKLLYEELMSDRNYKRWMEQIVLRWKEINENSPYKLNREIFNEFYKNYLKIKEGAKEFIEYCRSNFVFYVISEAPWEFCLPTKDLLGFDHYFATTVFQFDKFNQLKAIRAHKDGFHKEKIMFKIAKSYKFNKNKIIAIGDSEKDVTMLNEARFGIFVGKNITATSYQALNPNVIRMPVLNFEELKEKIERISIDMKQSY